MTGFLVPAGAFVMAGVVAQPGLRILLHVQAVPGEGMGGRGQFLFFRRQDIPEENAAEFPVREMVGHFQRHMLLEKSLERLRQSPAKFLGLDQIRVRKKQFRFKPAADR